MFIKKILFLGTILWASPFLNSNAAEKYSFSYNSEKENLGVRSIVELTLNEHSKKIDNPFIELIINIGQKYETKSYTNAKDNYCQININYKDNQPLLLSNFNDDLQFILWHEIGHCILGKKFLLKENIEWVVSGIDEDSLNKQIKKQNKIAFQNMYSVEKQHYFKIAPPMVVYHEIYADMYALNLWMKNNKDLKEITVLAKRRIEDFNENPISSLYASGFSIPIILESTKSKKSVDNIEEVSQRGFIKYLDFIKTNYLSK